MPDNPHEYCLRRNFVADSEFVYAVQYIRDHGVRECYGKTWYTCLYLNGFKYWTMGAPVNNSDGTPCTILINRARYHVEGSDYDGIAAEYVRKFSAPNYLEEDYRLFDLIRPRIRGRVLDIGCGTGLFLDYYRPDGYTGIDPSRGMLDILRKKHPEAETIHDRFENTYTGQYETIVALYGTASYLSPAAASLIHEHLAPEGLYFLMTYKPEYYPETHRYFGIDYECSGFSMPGANLYEFGNYMIQTNDLLPQK